MLHRPDAPLLVAHSLWQLASGTVGCLTPINPRLGRRVAGGARRFCGAARHLPLTFSSGRSRPPSPPTSDTHRPFDVERRATFRAPIQGRMSSLFLFDLSLLAVLGVRYAFDYREGIGASRSPRSCGRSSRRRCSIVRCSSTRTSSSTRARLSGSFARREAAGCEHDRRLKRTAPRPSTRDEQEFRSAKRRVRPTYLDTRLLPDRLTVLSKSPRRRSTLSSPSSSSLF